MRFISYRVKTGKWICCCIVKKWRPIYGKLNRLLSGMEGLAQWYLVTQEEFDGFTTGTTRAAVTSDAAN